MFTQALFLECSGNYRTQTSDQKEITVQRHRLYLHSFPAVFHYFVHSWWTLRRSFEAITIVN